MEITAIDFLKQQTALLKEAKQVLPGDPSICTFEKGYLHQPIYACQECQVGVCYGCFVSCHTTHKMVELFNKRHFRCDCGTKGDKCCIDVDKTGLKSENLYTHNFQGKFCFCNGPYCEEQDFMIQCTLCQDWFHDRCVEPLPDENDFDDFICKTCISQHPWLLSYTILLGKEVPRPPPTSDCKLVKLNQTGNAIGLNDWKKGLCHCNKCEAMYIDEKVEFLVNPDPVYEPPADADEDLYESSLKQLERVDRTKAMEGMYAYKNLEVKLKEFLRGFATKNQVVTDDDIQSFFSTLK